MMVQMIWSIPRAGMTTTTEKTIGVTEFKPQSLELIEEIASGKVQRLVLTPSAGKPVAAIVPIEGPPGSSCCTAASST